MAEQQRMIRVAMMFFDFFLEEDFPEPEEPPIDEDDDDLMVISSSLRQNNPAQRIKWYAEQVVPMYSPTEFQSHFRMTVTTFENLCLIVGNYDEMNDLYGHGGREIIPVEKQLLVILWTLGNKEAYRSIADRFNITKSSVCRILIRVSKCLVTHGQHFLYWPNAAEMNEISQKFEEKCRLPGVVGALDGCHIPIKAPSRFADTYINRKKFHSIILQGVCDNDLVFRDVTAGWPGSVHDARVLRNSPLFTEAERRVDVLFPGDKHLLGDSAYPLEKWLLTPYRDNGHLTREQGHFNFAQHSGRQVIERCFALLKGRFRRLKYLEMNTVTALSQIITACCILHNICLSAGDMIYVEEEEEDANNIPVQYVGNHAQQGINKRDRIMRAL